MKTLENRNYDFFLCANEWFPCILLILIVQVKFDMFADITSQQYCKVIKLNASRYENCRHRSQTDFFLKSLYFINTIHRESSKSPKVAIKIQGLINLS